MIATCPKNPDHKRFVTVAAVTEDWIVDETGAFLDVHSNPDRQVVHGPDDGNIWTCLECGTEAEVKR